MNQISLISKDGRIISGSIGLVDNRGCFFLAVNSEDTKYYRFSNDNDALRSATECMVRAEKAIAKVQEKYDKLAAVATDAMWSIENPKERSKFKGRLTKLGVDYETLG